jgi:hypothetical protein
MAPVQDQEVAFADIQNNVQVHHPKFGIGKVMLRTGADEKTSKAIVRFKEEGEKKLALRYARLTVDKVEDEPVATADGAAGDE